MFDAATLNDPATLLVLGGAGLQTGAHVFRNQFVLRIMLLAGTCLYIAYYFVATPDPLWPAIIASAAIATTSVFGLIRTVVLHIRAKRVVTELPPHGASLLLHASFTLQPDRSPIVVVRGDECVGLSRESSASAIEQVR
ncbi:hypothetical protein N9H93_01695 [Rhizobiaceae bacterium]|nr:hypothetical protein [Rhizobiaceae bacterium]